MRRKEEGKLKAFEYYLVDEKKNTFLDALGLELFPWPLLEFIFIVKEILGAVFWNFLGFVGPCTAEVSSPPVGS